MAELRSFLKDNNAKFSCPEQAIAINAVLNIKKDMLIVLPTGAGKTLVYMLPIYIYKKNPARRMMAIVIVPLVALTFDLKRRCQDSGITYTTWKGILFFFYLFTETQRLTLACIMLDYADNSDRNADILFLAIEQCTDLSLLAFIDEKYQSNEITAIFVEEAHLIISWSDFRPHFNDLPSFRRYNSIPWILLSATVPYYLEQELSKMFGNMSVVRKNSNRPNLVFYCKLIDNNIEITNYVWVWIQKHCLRQRKPTIVYVREIKDIDNLVFHLNKLSTQSLVAVGYHGKMDTFEKEENQKKFMEETAFVIVATSSFGMGVNKNNVRVVVNAGIAYSGLEYLQMAGRGGRDNEKAYCITITNEKDIEKLQSYDKATKDNDLQFEVAKDQLKKYIAVVKVFVSIKIFFLKIITNQYSLE